MRSTQESEGPFGEGTEDEIFRACYPVLDKVQSDIFKEDGKEPEEAILIPRLAKRIRDAVKKERERLASKPVPKAQTERGRELAKRLGMGAALADHRVRQEATKVLKAYKPKGRKH